MSDSNSSHILAKGPHGCILCAFGNDLPPGEYCRACGLNAPVNIWQVITERPEKAPDPDDPQVWTSEEAEEMRQAYESRFGEPPPRTETLFAVAAIGYRIAMRRMRVISAERERKASSIIPKEVVTDAMVEAALSAWLRPSWLSMKEQMKNALTAALAHNSQEGTE